jgi:ribonuclease D
LNYILVNTPSALATSVDAMRTVLARDNRLAIDTEFVGEKSYEPLLELIQVATADGAIHLMDARALQGALDPLAQVFNDPGVLKLMHAAGQDVGILQSWMGVYATPLFDVQVAAAFVGHPLQVGYGKLVAAELKARLPKDEGVSDWTRRPFPPAMLEYAAADVEHLHVLHDKLTHKLNRNGRTDWAREATEQLLESHTRKWGQDDLWRRVNGRQSLSRRELAILRELSIWRDEDARERNRPRRSVMKDEVLIELARRAPDSVRAMHNLRSIPPNLGERRMQEVVDAVKTAKALHTEQLPETEQSVQLDDQGAALYELLSAVVRIRAIETDLPAQLLAPSDALRQAAADRALATDNMLAIGWRGELLGADLSHALAGKSALAWDAAEGRLVIREI